MVIDKDLILLDLTGDKETKMLKMLLNILKLKKKFLGFFLNLGNPLFHFIVKIILKMKWRNNDEKSSNYNSVRF